MAAMKLFTALATRVDSFASTIGCRMTLSKRPAALTDKVQRRAKSAPSLYYNTYVNKILV